MLDQLRGLQMAVESPPGGLLVRVGGELTTVTGPRLLRLLDGLTGRSGAAHPRPARVVVDLANVRAFDRDGVGALEHARRAAAARGVELVLSGLDAYRMALLPQRIEQALSRLEPVGTG